MMTEISMREQIARAIQMHAPADKAAGLDIERCYPIADAVLVKLETPTADMIEAMMLTRELVPEVTTDKIWSAGIRVARDGK